MKQPSFSFSFSLLLVLAVFWLLNSGQYSLLMLMFGCASIFFVRFLTAKMTVVDRESLPIYLSPNIFGYLLWLCKEIILANLTVLQKIWFGNKSLSPTFTKISISQTTDMGKVIYANSITLTPGTVAVDLKDNQILVHALDYKSVESLELGEMDTRVTELEAKC